MRHLTTRLLFLAASLAAAAPQAQAQWSADPAQNLGVRIAPSDQNQAKLAATPDGGVWLSWLDGIGSGWDVRVQRLTAGGLEGLPAGGVLVADRSLSSTQDYGLASTPGGDALLAYRGPTGSGIYAARVSPDGSLAWGAGGVQLSSASGFAPKVCGTADGGAIAIWGEGSAVRVAKLDGAGALLWSSQLSPTAGSYFASDVQATGSGAIVAVVHQTGGFSSPKHLRAQRFDGAGSPLWGPGTLAVFDGGSLQFGSFPSFVTDGAGGAVFRWYSSSPSLQTYAQRVDASGAELWPHNGVALSANGTRLRVSPDASFDATSGETTLFWTELNSSQSQSGVWGQRLDAAGNRLWGSAGSSLVPLSAPTHTWVRALPAAAGGAWAAWLEAPSFGNDVLRVARVDGTGQLDLGPLLAASTPSGKARLAATQSCAPSGFGILAWSDARSDGGDLYAQNLNQDGSLGSQVGGAYCGPAVANSTGQGAQVLATGSPVAGHNQLELLASQLPEGQAAYFLASQTPGFVAQPPGSQGNLCLGGQIARLNAQVGLVSGGRYAVRVDLSAIPTNPPSQVLAGETWRFQCWFRDLNPGNTSNFTDAVAVPFL